MKWGRKKASLSSSSRPSLISSWLGKFKKMGTSISSSLEQKPEREKHRGRLNSPASTGSHQYTGGKGGRFYGEDGDDLWRMSFGEKGADRCASRNTVQSARYDSYGELDVPEPNCQSCRTTSTIAEQRENTQKFSNMASGARKTREMSTEASLLTKLNICKREVEEDFETSRRVARRDCKLPTQDRRCLEQNLSEVEEESDAADIKPERMSENEFLEHGSVKTIRTYVSNSRMNGDETLIKSEDSCPETKEKDCAFSQLNMDIGDGVYDLSVSPDWQKLKDLKIAEFKAKTEKQRKSVHMSRELQGNKPKQGCKVGVFSPRITSKVEICKIKALEDMKKANRLRMKKKIRERVEGGKSNLENFAVAKRSYDPPKDFRDSMIEMIIEKRMHQPEELEELLACYLTLNSDEYHDLIIKVFKEVWFYLNQARLGSETQDQYCY